MLDVDKAINNEVGSVNKRFYITLVSLFLLVDYIDAPQIMLLMFLAPPPDAFKYNPNAKNAESIITEWDLTGSKIWIPSLLQSIFFVGFMVGTILFGQLADKYGRRNVSWRIYTVVVVFSFLTAFCQNWQQLFVCRIVCGLAVGGLSVVNTIFVQELSAARLWVINGAVISIVFTTCMLIFLAFAYYFPSWRTLCIASSMPSLLGYLYYFVLPESPRWLFTQGRLHEAERAIAVITKVNGGKSADYQISRDELKTHNMPETQTRKSSSILDLFRYPVLRYRTFILASVWFSSFFVYFSLTLSAGSFISNFYLAYGMSAISQLPAVPLCIYFMEKEWWGRRRTLAGLMFLTAVCMLGMFSLQNNDENAPYRLIFSVAAKVGSSGCTALVYVYTPELYPTVVRNVGLGSMSTCARIGSMAAPFLASYTINTGSNLPFLCYAFMSMIGGMLALKLPETRGKRIIDTIQEACQQEEKATS